jgi:hypothetical protein
MGVCLVVVGCEVDVACCRDEVGDVVGLESNGWVMGWDGAVPLFCRVCAGLMSRGGDLKSLDS